MIQANDLRIGNLLKFNEETVDVESIGFDGVNLRGGYDWSIDCEFNYDELEPIPLTEDILLKCGFVKHKAGIGGCDMWQGMDAWEMDDEWLFRGSPERGLKLIGYFNSNIQYLHQLQNLYFALTGSELNIQL